MRPNIYPDQAKAIGLLPIIDKPVKFAIGPPDGLTSNTWRIWSTRKGDVYLKCRDNFTEAKVSLHSSGRWRMGFTTEAVAKYPGLLKENQNRAWEVWNKPTELIPDCIAAFQLIFAKSELAVRPEQRQTKKWKDVIFIEEPPDDKLLVVTIFITKRDIDLKHESEPSFCLASFAIGDDNFVKIIIHTDKIGDFNNKIEQTVSRIIQKAKQQQLQIPKNAYVYFYGNNTSGIRFISGARANRQELHIESKQS